MGYYLQLFGILMLVSVVCAQYPSVLPTVRIIDDGCPLGTMRSKAGACIVSSGTLIPVPALDGVCPAHYYEIDGKCHRPPEPNDKCPVGYTLRRGKCRPIVNPCPYGFDYAYGYCEHI